jgi:tRNA(fMet)-specific endonuclease VapC
MDVVVVDTDVVSFGFKGDSRARLFHRHLVGRLGVISFMTLAELDRWALHRRWGEALRQRLDVFLGRYTLLDSDRGLCHLWAKVTHQADRRGRPIQCADAWIAAAALHLDAPLVTNNPSDFASLSGLSVLTSTSP